MEQQERLVKVLEEQLAYMKKQNEELSMKLDQSLAQNKVLSEQIFSTKVINTIVNKFRCLDIKGNK